MKLININYTLLPPNDKIYYYRKVIVTVMVMVMVMMTTMTTMTMTTTATTMTTKTTTTMTMTNKWGRDCFYYCFYYLHTLRG